MYQKIIEILEKSEESKMSRFFYVIFLPISALLEYLCFRHFNKIIQEELSNEEFIEFLDKNEFGYKNNTIYKMDIIESEYHKSLKQDVLKNTIRNEVTNSMIDMISKITNIGVEELLSVTVQLFQNKEKIKYYKVSIQYYRYLLVLENRKFLITWFVLVIAIILSCVFLPLLWR
jgi:hypothetical protein